MLKTLLQINVKAMIKRLTGSVNIQWWKKKASTAFNNGGFVYADGSGAIQPADATAGNILGIMMKDVASGDSDYASNTLVPVDVPRPNDEFLADVGTGTAAATDPGLYYDLKDDNELDVSATSKKVVLVKRFISTTQLVIEINAMAGHKNVETS